MLQGIELTDTNRSRAYSHKRELKRIKKHLPHTKNSKISSFNALFDVYYAAVSLHLKAKAKKQVSIYFDVLDCKVK